MKQYAYSLSFQAPHSNQNVVLKKKNWSTDSRMSNRAYGVQFLP